MRSISVWIFLVENKSYYCPSRQLKQSKFFKDFRNSLNSLKNFDAKYRDEIELLRRPSPINRGGNATSFWTFPMSPFDFP